MRKAITSSYRAYWLLFAGVGEGLGSVGVCGGVCSVMRLFSLSVKVLGGFFFVFFCFKDVSG